MKTRWQEVKPKMLYETVLDKAQIAEGHCQGTQSVGIEGLDAKLVPCPERNLVYGQDLILMAPDICTTELRQCPGCKLWLCQECWEEHDISHFGKSLLFDFCWVCHWDSGDSSWDEDYLKDDEDGLELKKLPPNFKAPADWTECPRCGAKRSSRPTPPLFHG